MTRLHPDFLTVPLAHRGLHDKTIGCQENSVTSFEAAIANGYGIELDLQLSSDGVPMVFHDYQLDRLTHETGPVAQRTAQELQDIPLLYGNETIPTLETVLNVVAGQVPLLIELKDQDGGLGPNVGVMEKATCELVKDYSGPVALMSFNPHSVDHCQTQAPEVTRGLVTDAFDKEEWSLVKHERLEELKHILDYDRVGASFISHDRNNLTSPIVLKLKSSGADVLCWTVRSTDQEDIARQVAQNITFEGYMAQQ